MEILVMRICVTLGAIGAIVLAIDSIYDKLKDTGFNSKEVEKLNDRIDLLHHLRDIDTKNHAELSHLVRSLITKLELRVVNVRAGVKIEEKHHKHESDGLLYTSNPPRSKCIKCGEFY